MSLDRLATARNITPDERSQRFDDKVRISYILRAPLVEDTIRSILKKPQDYNIPRIVILTSEMREELEDQLRPLGYELQVSLTQHLEERADIHLVKGPLR